MGVLLLNASYEPLTVVSTKRAVILVLKEKAVVLEEAEEPLRAAKVSIPTPSVIKLTYYVKVPVRARKPLCRRAVLMRDKHRCAYCGKNATTMDHVVPRAKGGLHRWENIVAACSRCNAEKADKLLAELGWSLPFEPKAPHGVEWVIVGVAKPDPAWGPYLYGGLAVT